MWISFVSSRLKLKCVEGWIIWTMSPLEALKGSFSTQSPFPNGLWVRRIWRQTMEVQQPTQLVSHACFYVCIGKSCHHWLCFLNFVDKQCAGALTAYVYDRTRPCDPCPKASKGYKKLMISFIDHSARWSFHRLDLLSPHLTFCWFGMAQFQLRGFSGPSGKCFLKNPGFWGIHQAGGKSRGFSSCPTNS